MASILNFDNFYTNIREAFEPNEISRMQEIGLNSVKKFDDALSVLDFFGGSMPISYDSAKMEAAQAGYRLLSSLYDEAVMMAEDGEMNNPIFSAGQNEAIAFDEEYIEGPGAPDHEIEKHTREFYIYQNSLKNSGRIAHNIKLKDFTAFANGESAELKNYFFPEWKKEDFAGIIKGLKPFDVSMPGRSPLAPPLEETQPKEMFEATEADVAQRKSAIEAENAEIAKADADLAVRSQNIKPLDPTAMAQKATLAADYAALEIRKADLAKKRAEVAAIKVVPTQQ